MSKESVEPMSEEKPENECTCQAPPGAVHNKGCPLAIWTPPEKLDANVQRMAWLLFIECWKHDIGKTGYTLDDPPFIAKHVHQNCLAVAKGVRESELEAGGQ